MNKPFHFCLLAAFCSFAFFTGTLHAQVPILLNYQGRVVVGTTNFDGSGKFRFALVDPTGNTTTYWSNDGTSVAGSQPTAFVTLPVTKGLCSIMLGNTDPAKGPVTTAIPASVFTNPDVRLAVWFDDGTNGPQRLAPDQRIAPTAYLADGSVTSAKIAANAVGWTHIAAGAVGSTQLAAGAVQIGNIAIGAVGAAQIAPGAIGSNQLDATLGLWTASGGNIFRNGGNVGIGTTSPQAKLDVQGDVRSRSGGFRFPDDSIQRSAASVTSFFNVQQFGAAGDGVADDTDEIEAAILAQAQAGGGTLFFPRGQYILSRQLQIGQSVFLLGEGRQLSKLIWTAANGGLRFNGGSGSIQQRKTFRAQAITFLTTIAGGGVALDLSSEVPVGNVGRTVDILECEFSQANPDAWWTCGIRMADIRDTSILNCEIRGKYPFPPGSRGIQITGDLPYIPTGHTIDNTLITFVDYGIEVTGHVEAVILHNSAAVACNRCVVWNTATQHPQLTITNTHLSAFATGVELYNCSDSFIQNSLLYFRPETQTPTIGVYIGNGSAAITLAHNTIRYHEGPLPNAVVVGSGAHKIRIESNQIVNASSGVWLQSGSHDCYVLDNDFTNVSPTYRILNEGVGHFVRAIP